MYAYIQVSMGELTNLVCTMPAAGPDFENAGQTSGPGTGDQPAHVAQHAAAAMALASMHQAAAALRSPGPGPSTSIASTEQPDKHLG
jgi:hypothetical protein